MKIHRREWIAAGGLLAGALGFSQTLKRMGLAIIGSDHKSEDRFNGLSAQPEFHINPNTGELKLNPNQQISYTTCLGCTTMCGVRVRIDKNTGKVIRVGGNPYNPLANVEHIPIKTSVKASFQALSQYQNQGLLRRATVCGRGNAILEQLESPFRVLQPLKRVGPRNSGQWQAISFEQLIKEIVHGGDLFGEGHVDGLAQLRQLDQAIDKKAPKFGPKVNQVGVLTSVNEGREALARRFWNKAYGTQNFVRHGSYCGGSYRSGSGALFGDHKAMPHAKPDIPNAEFIIFIGTAPGSTGNPFRRTGELIAKARSQGQLDYVVIDPVLY